MRVSTTMTVRTTRFGNIKVDDNMIIDFENGLVGFPALKKFCIVEHTEVIKWLQSVDAPEVAFIVTNPFSLIPDYSFEIDAGAEQHLDIIDASTLVTLVMLSVRQDGVTANLRTPVLINTENMKGAQLTIENSRVPVRFSLEPAIFALESAA